MDFAVKSFGMLVRLSLFDGRWILAIRCRRGILRRPHGAVRTQSAGGDRAECSENHIDFAGIRWRGLRIAQWFAFLRCLR
jgi:hypothetical protein